jgi:hypothetical protein
MAIGTIKVDCASLGECSAATIDLIARIKLATLRRGVDLKLENSDAPLVELIELCGLAEVLRVEPERQAE